jgi:hypothetical protein
MNVEKTGFRSLEYSEFRRTIGDKLYHLDLDWIEWRSGRGIVALIETKKYGDVSQFQRLVYTEIAKKLNIPAFVVTYHNLEKFLVKDMFTDKIQILTQEEYKEFIKNL